MDRTGLQLLLAVALCFILELGYFYKPLFLRPVKAQECSPISWNREAVPGYCSTFSSACVDHGSRIVLHEDRYQIDNVRRENTPQLPDIRWNLPLRLSAFPDALGGWQPDFSIHVRPVSKVEPTPSLRHPRWSNCTLPVVLFLDYPYNYKTFVVKALSQVDRIFRIGGLAPGNDATLVLATPTGLALEPYHAVLLSLYSRFPLVTLAELGRRGMEGAAAEWSGEGVRVHCFSQLVACKLDHQDRASPQVAAAAVLSYLGSAVPSDPFGLGTAARDSPHVLRVVIEERSASWRTIRNVAALLQACQEADAKGFTAGPFTRIICKALPSSPHTTYPPATGIVNPASPAVAAFRSALGAVRSAHLFIAAVGSIGAHAFFMDPDLGRGGSGFVEVRPCGWGSEHSSRADEDDDAMAAQLQQGSSETSGSIRFFAYNVEDPAQCAPPDYQPQLATARSSLEPSALQGSAHPSQRKSAPRYSPEELLVRDQHVELRPGPLLAMLRHAASLLGDTSAYQAARSAGRLHGYAVTEGLLLGPLGLRDAGARAVQAAQEGAEALIRAAA